MTDEDAKVLRRIVQPILEACAAITSQEWQALAEAPAPDWTRHPWWDSVGPVARKEERS